MPFFKDELKKIRAFVLDIDGVLSRQTQSLSPEGELVRTSCAKDGYAIMYGIRKGYIVAVISGGGAPRSAGTPGKAESETGGYLSENPQQGRSIG